MSVTRPVLLLLLSLLTPRSAVADVSPTLPDRVTGLVCWIEPPSDRMVVELTAREGVVVYAVVSQPDRYRSLTAAARESGRLGRTLYVDRRDPHAPLPFPDRFVDLSIGPATTDRVEMLRVTSPERGRVLHGAEVLVPPRPPGMDDWTHRLHGPDNNPASRDTVFRGPPVLQYLSTPLQTSFQGGLLAAGGRRFELSDWATKTSDRNAVAGSLRARSLYNGLLLWERQLPRRIEPDMPICAVDDRFVYLADDAGPRVLRIDAETGADAEPIVVADDPDTRVNWLGLEAGRIYALLGPPLQVRTAFEYVGGGNHRNRKLQFQAGTTVVCRDLRDGREIWRHVEPSTIDYRTLAVHEGRVYLFSEGRRLLCLDGDGGVVWENAEAGLLSALRRSGGTSNINTEATSTLSVGHGGVLRVGVPGSRTSLMVDTQSGRILWEATLAAPKCVFLDAGVLMPPGLLDARTGKKLADARIEGGGCGILTWVPGLDAAVSHVAVGVKSPCGVGGFAAGGLLHFAASHCDCWPHVRGGAAFGSGASESAQPAHPLVGGAGLANAGPAATGGWLQYRGDLRHRGFATEGPVPHATRVVPLDAAYDVPPGHDLHRIAWLDRPTPPVTADGLAVYGGSDGQVRAIDTATATPVWTHWTGGAVFTAPSIEGRRVFVASADGWVHCLNLHDGSLLWKWRAAPADRMLSIYGRLMSAWPVTSVLAHGGRLYGVAGMWMQNGSAAFCLDGASGEPVWISRTAPFLDATRSISREEYGFGPCGYLTVVGDHLVVRGHLGFPGMFHVEDGRRIRVDDRYPTLDDGWNLGWRVATAGQDIVVVDDHTILQGGTPLLANPDMRHDNSSAKYVAWQTDDQGRITADPLPAWAIPHSQIAPALDDRHIAVVGGVGKNGRSAFSTIGLSLWERRDWKNAYTRAADPVAASGPGAADRVARLRDVTTVLDLARARWRIDDVDVSGLLLTPDTVVVAHGERASPRGKPPTFTAWRLTGHDRATGERRWSVPLPAEPVLNGLAPTASGYVLTLRDGSLAIVSGDAAPGDGSPK